jgi:beta-galactosidase
VSSFTIGESDFLLDGAPHRVLSGAIHYFRVHPDQWADRIHKARLMGLNTIETYVAWNAHEPARGQWDATGPGDLGRFLDLVAAEGLHAIVRPGPYICAEWHNGGLPAWLTALPGVGLRRSEPTYLAELDRYLRRVYDIVVPRQIDRGGPVLLVQIENEYGAYGDDQDYLRELVRITRDAGVTVPLTTVDQPQPQMLRDGSLPELHRTGSFGSHSAQRLATLREHQPTGPLMCAEFWDGWFDWWGGVHHTTGAEQAAAELETLLAAGASVNIYMFHGGTNFALTNGANHKGRYLPLTTSYDYDAPLDEAGNPTPKFFALRDVIARYAPVPDEVPADAAPAPTPEAVFTATAPLFEAAPVIASGAPTAIPLSFDDLGVDSGLVRYRATLPAGSAGGVLEVDAVRDGAWVFVDGARAGRLSRSRHERALVIPAGRRIDILVEEQGRVNYGSRLGETKGLIGAPRLNGAAITGWSADPVDLTGAAAASLPERAGTGPLTGPCIARGAFTLTEPADLFLDTDGWGHGFAFVNGFALGRYRATGPQRTLYVPGPVTRVGQNEITVIELEQLPTDRARFVPAPLLGPTEE